MEINLIVAAGKDGAIGRNGDLVWHIKEDLKRFKSLTMGHPVIMGRKTWESLPKRPLPGRHNIVMTRQSVYEADGATVVSSIDEALKAAGDESPFIMGGATIYEEFLPLATGIYLTEIDASCEDADAFLQLDLKEPEWSMVMESDLKTTEDGIPYRYIDYKKKEA